MKSISRFAILALAAGCISNLAVNFNCNAQTAQRIKPISIKPNNEFYLVRDTSGVFACQALQIYPIYATPGFLKQSSIIGNYLSLKEAMEKDLVIISETEGKPHPVNQREDDEIYPQPRRAQVNTLYMENISKDTVFIMAGEIVKGGRQDRMIGRDFLLPPNSGMVNLDVFCVEHGRWTYNSGTTNEKFSYSATPAANSMREAAVEEKDQSMVWDRVAKLTAKNNATSSTGTYEAMEKSSSYTSSLGQYMAELWDKFENSDDVIGVIAASGDRIIGCDLFCNPELFKKEYSTLLRSYATEAISNPASSKKRIDTAQEYFQKVYEQYHSEDRKNDHMLVKNGIVIHYSSFDFLTISSFIDRYGITKIKASIMYMKAAVHI